VVVFVIVIGVVIVVVFGVGNVDGVVGRVRRDANR